MPRFNLIERPQPFLGMLAAAGGWALSHQIASNKVFDDCTQGGIFTVVVSIIGLLITGSGGAYCVMAASRAEGSGRRAIAVLGALLSLLAGFAIVLQIFAGAILAECAA